MGSARISRVFVWVKREYFLVTPASPLKTCNSFEAESRETVNGSLWKFEKEKR